MSLELKRRPIRVWVNQPSNLQPLHVYHGRKGLLLEYESGQCEMYFDDDNSGKAYSSLVDLSWVSKEFV
jgi:hypothetical protein